MKNKSEVGDREWDGRWCASVDRKRLTEDTFDQSSEVGEDKRLGHLHKELSEQRVIFVNKSRELTISSALDYMIKECMYSLLLYPVSKLLGNGKYEYLFNCK